MNKENSFQQKNVIHSMDKESYRVKFNISFLQETDKYKEFLRLLYISSIGNVMLPEPMIPNANNIIDDLFMLLDWAWLEYFERQERSSPGGHSTGVAMDMPRFIDYTVDSYYPNLQQSRWIKDRRERYVGNIIYLSQDEIFSEYSFFDSLFRKKTITEWKSHIEKWISFAIDTDNNIVDTGITTAYDAYQDYVYLQKLVECCWISIKQDERLNYQDLCPWFSKDNYPVFSTIEYAFNPYDEIYGLFHYDSLIAQKKKINTWFAAVLHTETVWEGVASDLIDFYRRIGLMIECCWVIKELGPNYPKEWNNYNSYFSSKRAKDVGDNHPFKLKELKEKPESYLQQFFRHRNLNDCRHILYECLYTSLGPIEYDPFTENEIKMFKKDLIMLLEAAYLIQKEKYPARVYLIDS